MFNTNLFSVSFSFRKKSEPANIPSEHASDRLTTPLLVYRLFVGTIWRQKCGAAVAFLLSFCDFKKKLNQIWEDKYTN